MKKLDKKIAKLPKWKVGKVQLNTYLPSKIHSQLKKYAKKNKITMTKLVCEMVIALLKEKK